MPIPGHQLWQSDRFVLARALVRSLVRGIRDTAEHDGMEHAGYIAFLGLLGIFPFLVFLTAMAGVITADPGIAVNITTMLETLPPQIIEAIEPRITEITTGPPQGLITIAILGAIWTSSSTVEGLRTILNRAYHVSTPPRYLMRRLLSIVQVVVLAFLLIVGMMLILTLPALIDQLSVWVHLPLTIEEAQWWESVFYVISLAFLTCVVAWTYYILPNIEQRWISVWPGAMIVVALWFGAAKLFSLYLQLSEQVTVIYGSLGGIIVFMLFFYICNIIFIFGAEFNYHLGTTIGMKVVEKENGESDPPANNPETPSSG